MTVDQINQWARKENHYSLVLLIEYLTTERNVLKGTDTEEQLTYYLQDKFRNKMNEYLVEYEVKRNG